MTIAKLLGHALVETTERYVHLSDRSMSEAAERVSGTTPARSRPPWPEAATPAMPTIDLTLQLARNSRPAQRDLFLFDQYLPGFGLRIHPSGRKVWIVQARIEGRTRRMVIARHGEMALA